MQEIRATLDGDRRANDERFGSLNFAIETKFESMDTKIGVVRDVVSSNNKMLEDERQAVRDKADKRFRGLV